MRKSLKVISAFLFGAVLIGSLIVTSCKKDDDGSTNDGKVDPSTIATANLVAYFPFEDNGNDVIEGLTPTSNPGVTYVTGKRSKAYQGADAAYFVYDLPTGSKLKTLPAFSISMWFYGTPAIDGVAPVPGIFQINGGTDANWGNLMLTQDRMLDAVDSLNMHMFFFKNGVDWSGQHIAFSKTAFVENFWYHVVYTYSSVTSKYMVYVNGTPLTLSEGITDRWAEDDTHNPRTAYGTLGFINATKFSIGGWMQRITGVSSDEWMGYFTGKMDELRIYDKGLSETEVMALFDAEVTQLNN